MNKLVAEIRAATALSIQKKKSDPSQPVVYEYDSDEDTEGGTWEHKLRAQEMLKTLGKQVHFFSLIREVPPCNSLRESTRFDRARQGKTSHRGLLTTRRAREVY